MPKFGSNEKALYGPMSAWLKQTLIDKYRGATIEVYPDTATMPLSKLIALKNYGHLFAAEWTSWDIRVDITGIIINNDKAELAFIEAKDIELSLAELSQLLGYSRVAHPLHAFLLSPKGCSGSLTSLLRSFGRRDVLVYHEEKGRVGRTINVAKWDIARGTIDQASLIS